MKHLSIYLFIIFSFGLITNAHSTKLDESDRNLEKIHRAIVYDVNFYKKSKYKDINRGYHPYNKSRIQSYILAVYINYDDLIKKVTKNPELDSIGDFAWGFEFSKKNHQEFNGEFSGKKALKKCNKHAKKKKLSGGECIILEWQNNLTGSWGFNLGKNLLKKQRSLNKRIASNKSNELDESDEILNKLYKKIITSPSLQKQSKYLKYANKGKFHNTKFKTMALAVYFDYEDEIRKLMLNPYDYEFKTRAWGWQYFTNDNYNVFISAWNNGAAAKCNKMVILHELKGGRCIMLDFRKAKIKEDTRYIKNLLFDEREQREIVAKNLNKKKDKDKSELAKKKAEEEKKNQELLVKQKAEEEKKNQELIAKQKAEEEKKNQELIAKQKAEEEKKKQELLVQKKSKKKFDKKKKKAETDNSAPEIIVAENITTKSQVYVLKGTVKDKSEFIFEIDGQPLELDKKGDFIFEGFVIDENIGEELNLVAIDRWNNVSEKTVKIKVKLEETKVVKSFEKLMPNKINIKKNNNRVALIIGIEKYENLENLDAIYANRDAKAFKAYANRALGVPADNIKLLVDKDASRSETLKALKIWLPQKTKGSKKDIFIFFAGHGLASDNGEDLYVLPQDGDSILLEDTAISRLEIFDQIKKLNPNSVTMFFDTCYSGQTRKEETLIAGLRPVRIVADEKEVPINFNIFSASSLTQTSGSIDETQHGIFSYYLMKGLEGKADLNQNRQITNGELIAYLKEKVSQEAFANNRNQEPTLNGNPDKIIISY